jgi:DTW domain-containing protein YfiP
MHPQEAYKQKTGTGRLAKLSLKNSELIIDEGFNHQVLVNMLLENPDYYPVILYPGINTVQVEDPGFKFGVGTKKLLVFIIDATWAKSRKMMRLSTKLRDLPKISFQNAYRSQFSIKRQPHSHCLSTIESTYYLIHELQNAGFIDSFINPEGLMTVFKKMVAFQHSCNPNSFNSARSDLTSIDHLCIKWRFVKTKGSHLE